MEKLGADLYHSEVNECIYHYCQMANQSYSFQQLLRTEKALPSFNRFEEAHLNESTYLNFVNSVATLRQLKEVLKTS